MAVLVPLGRRQIHRWLGVAMLLPMVVWIATGLLFFLKPGWDAAYDLPSAFRDGNPSPVASLSIADVAQKADALGPTSIHLKDSARGSLFVVYGRDGVALFDGHSGDRLDPLGKDDIHALVTDAIASSPHASRYGELETLELSDDRATIVTTTDVTLTLDRRTASLRQEGPDTRRINWLYRLHYLQWTGTPTLDRILGLLGLALLTTLTLLGFSLVRTKNTDRRTASS